MSDHRQELAALCHRVAMTGAELRSHPRLGIRDSLVNAARFLRDEDPLVREAITRLASTTGLSEPMVRWALQSTAEMVTTPALSSVLAEVEQWADGRSIVPAHMGAVVLAGNVFTAALRPMFVHLLLGCPVIVKASSKEPHFARLVRDAIARADAPLAHSVGVTAFPGGDTDAERALFAEADVVSVYGNDDTIEAIGRRVPPKKQLLAHGHGFGLAYVSASALDNPGRWTRALALDIAAYDQRGCLSPHAIFVERRGSISPRDFAAQLAKEALSVVSGELPRGPLPLAAGAAQVQWRGVARATGELFEGTDCAVSYEDADRFRPSPGYRNVAVHPIDDWTAFVRRAEPLSTQLKCLGIADDNDDLPAWNGATRVCVAGTMQTPPFDLRIEGREPWAGLVRFE